MKKVDLWFLFIDKFRCQRATLEKFITKNSDATKKGEELSENVLKIFNVRLFFLLTFPPSVSRTLFRSFFFKFWRVCLAAWKCRRFCFVIFLHCLALFSLPLFCFFFSTLFFFGLVRSEAEKRLL